MEICGENKKKNYQNSLILDCANGIGSITMSEVINTPKFQKYININLINDDKEPNYLNEMCGAEYIHKNQKLPSNWNSAKDVNKKCTCFDGDADR